MVGPARRGLAMWLNEFAGYLALSLAALASGYPAATYALRHAAVPSGRRIRARRAGALGKVREGNAGSRARASATACSACWPAAVLTADFRARELEGSRPVCRQPDRTREQPQRRACVGSLSTAVRRAWSANRTGRPARRA